MHCQSSFKAHQVLKIHPPSRYSATALCGNTTVTRSERLPVCAACPLASSAAAAVVFCCARLTCKGCLMGVPHACRLHNSPPHTHFETV